MDKGRAVNAECEHEPFTFEDVEDGTAIIEIYSRGGVLELGINACQKCKALYVTKEKSDG